MSERRTASSRRRNYDDAVNMDNAEEESALAALASWTSPRVGAGAATTPAAASFQYERSPVEWMKRTLEEEPLDMDRDSFMDEDDDEEDDQNEDDQEEALRQAPAAARGRLATPRVLQRADTPVMSNSSKKTTTATTTAFLFIQLLLLFRDSTSS